MAVYSTELNDPNGVLFSQLDADPTKNYSDGGTIEDQQVNTTLDGNEQQFILGIDSAAQSGSFQITVTSNAMSARSPANVTLSPTYTNGNPPVIDINATRTAFQNQLAGQTAIFGNASVVVRTITPQEIAERTNTYWDIGSGTNGGLGLPRTGYDYYEVTLVNESNDINFSITSDSSAGTTTYNGNTFGATLITDYDPASMKKPGPGGTQTTTVNANIPEVATETVASSGTTQEDAALAVTPSGNFVVAWTQDNAYSNGTWTGDNNIYFRTYQESTDTAGPLATDFIEANGTRLVDGGEVNQTMQYVAVTFDEPMMTTGTSSVTNPQNWALMQNGTVINGGIAKIYYGLNMASQLGQWSIEDPADYGQNGKFGDFTGLLNAPASNKFEAVLVLDGNGQAAGTPALSNGNYQLVALNSLRDVAGNPLGRTGYVINGGNFSRSFSIAVPSGSETIVNTTTPGDSNHHRRRPNPRRRRQWAGRRLRRQRRLGRGLDQRRDRNAGHLRQALYHHLDARRHYPPVLDRRQQRDSGYFRCLCHQRRRGHGWRRRFRRHLVQQQKRSKRSYNKLGRLRRAI